MPVIEAALRTALVEDLGLKPRLAFGPVRAAVTGRRISPPLFESIELLGRESTLARIAAALAELGEPEMPGPVLVGATSEQQDRSAEIVTKQKKPAVPDRTSSKMRSGPAILRCALGAPSRCHARSRSQLRAARHRSSRR